MTIVLSADYFGVFVFAITGAIVAARKEMDVFGFVVLALMPAVGGGTLRDLVLDVPVFWINDTNYLFITLAAAWMTFVGMRYVVRFQRALLWLDAFGLAVFCSTGTLKALAVSGDPVIGVVMGVITAVAGGIIRDVIANELPLVLHREVYATAATAGSVICALVWYQMPEFALVAGVLAAFGVRSLGIYFGLSLPAFKPGTDSDVGPEA